MPSKLLVANRGEVALRIARAADALGIAVSGVYTADDRDSAHVRRFPEAVQLPGSGAAGYLDVGAVIAAAQRVGAEAVHPGYGLLSESAALARACADAGLLFVGPGAEVLELFGDKGRARTLAAEHRVPIVPGTSGPTSLAELREFVERVPPPVVIKALAGGGGRGMRVVRRREDLAEAFERCAGEARASFGTGELYVERLVEGARHIEVQIIGDGERVAHLWDRDCTVQRRHQKLIEIAPAGGLAPDIRAAMLAAATRLARAVRYRGLLTVEFLLDGRGEFFFMEANPRLQVEHTVTEEVLGVDLVRAQLRVCAGAALAELGLTQDRIPEPRGHAVQLRINAETVDATRSTIVPVGGTVRQLVWPTGRGVRIESAAYPGYRVNPAFDSLLAKLVVHADEDGLDAARRFAARALAELRVDGLPTNAPLHQAILASREFTAGRWSTDYLDQHLAQLAGELAALGEQAEEPDGAAVLAPLSGTIVAVEVAEGDAVSAGQTLAVVEAMKMQHPLRAQRAGWVSQLLVKEGQLVEAGTVVARLALADEDADLAAAGGEPDPDHVRPDLAELTARTALLADEARPERIARRAERGMRTARQNVADLVDPGSFVEYGGLAIAAQRQRRDLDDLIRHTPADGLITGTGTVNAATFGPEKATCAVLAYDYTVLAGTQGYWNHRKTDRILQVAAQHRYPVVLFAEGGGGRPGDVDAPKVAGLTTRSFSALAELSGVAPLIGIAQGHCFAGNAALLGTCDVVIATRDSNIGMGGPAMIEGGGLGRFRPEEIGPIEVQTANGVVDIEVAGEVEAVRVAKRYLGYFQGPLPAFEEHDQRRMRHVVPENRKRVYDVRQAITLLCDVDSVLELRPTFGRTTITALVRIAGRPMGLIANDPRVLGGAIDADGADKLARFLRLCDVFGLPVVSLCDTPGFMVGPAAETTATVRHFARLFVLGAHLGVPMAVVVLRKAYGLGAMAMAAGSLHNPALVVAWPSGEFGGMGLEGAVQLGFRRELEAIADPEARQARYEELVAEMYQRGKAINAAMHLEIDDVIDPARTRCRVLAALPEVPRDGWTNPRARVSLDPW